MTLRRNGTQASAFGRCVAIFVFLFYSGVYMSSASQSSTGWLDGASRPAIVALGVAVVVAVIGVAEAYKGRSDMAAMKAQLAAVGLDASTADTLGLSIAAKKRELNRVESALVSYSAAAEARQQQVATAATLVGKLETAAAEATAAEAKASAIFADLDPKNRVLERSVRELENRIVAVTAASAARDKELKRLIADVERNSVLVAEAAMWRTESARLTADKEKLSRQVVGLQNEIVALTSAVTFRKQEVAKAMVDKSNAENDQRLALKNAVELRAESEDLAAAISKLTADRKVAERQYYDANNRLVPALAAVKRREEQLTKLNGTVQKLESEVASLAARHEGLAGELAAADDRLGKLANAARTAAEHLAAIDQLLGAPTVQAALSAQ